MKLLLAQNMIYLPTLGGANKANRLLFEGLAEKGHACRVVAPSVGSHGPRNRARFLEELGGRGLGVSSSGGINVFTSNGVEVHAPDDGSAIRECLHAQIEEFRPDYVLVSTEDPGQQLLRSALEAAPGRVVIIVHSPIYLPFGPHSYLTDSTNAELFRHAAGVVTVSRFVRDYMLRFGDIDSTVLPFPVYGPGPFPNMANFDDGFVTLINPCAYKGISIFLELAGRLPAAAFAGVPTWGTTEADRAAMDRLPNVTVLPPSDRIEEIFARTRILLMPSLWVEAFGLLAMEAMLRGIPVIASDAGGLAEAKLGVDYVLPVRPIEEYERRFDDRQYPVAIIPEQVIDPWEQTLRTLLADRGLYERLSRQSHDSAHAFIAGVGVGPFEDYLQCLPSAANHPANAPPRRADRDPSANTDLRKLASGLSPEKRALLIQRLRQKSKKTGSKAPSIGKREDQGSWPLSFAQQRLWFLEQLDPDSPVYSELAAFRLKGPLDRDALEKSLSEIIRRHEVLRAAFEKIDGHPVQNIAPPRDERLTVEDLQGLPREEQERRIGDRGRQLAQQRFDLARGRLFRATLLSLSGTEHALLLAMHHIVADGWSMTVFLRELASLYESFSAGRAPLLPELPIQYADFARWQRQWMETKEARGQLDYWKKKLSGLPPTLELPFDRPRPPQQTHRGRQVTIAIPDDVADGLKDLSRKEGATLFMTTLAAFKALIHRYIGQDDIFIGSPVYNRNRVETEPLIGLLVNTFVLRTDLSGDPTFRELLRRVRGTTLEAYANQDVPFESVVDEVSPDRSLSHSPLAQAMFVLHNAPLPSLEFSGLSLSGIHVDNETAKFDLTLALIDMSDVPDDEHGLVGFIEYNTDLFDAATIDRMLGHYNNFLGAIVTDADRPLSDLPLLTEAERRQVTVEWNATARDYRRDVTLVTLIEEQVERTPDAVAVEFEDESLTYARLNRRANQLARHLIGLGVVPDTPVGICIERSTEMVTGLLAILKAGGAYVPLDPDYPKDRLAFMLEDSGAPLLLTQEKFAGEMRATGKQVLSLDGEWDTVAREETGNPAVPIAPADLAYVIYTSGSTGRPKGVMVPHGGICNRLFWMQEEYGLTAADRVLQKTPFSFDVSVWEFFWPLLTGARLVVALPGGHQDSAYLVDTIVRRGITVLHFVPSMLQAFVGEAGLERCRSLRHVICSGEALPAALQRRFFQRLNTGLHNLYGPTEASVDVTYWECRPDDERSFVPIGRPVANTRIHILDSRLQPMPVGVPGELHIGGVQLARGYLNRPELTAEKFIADPFSPAPGARLYKTGDLARWLPDGSIEYIGRLDHQVKIRGFRIELGEIQSVLERHPDVAEAVVIDREDNPGDKRLAAYVVPSRKPAPGVGELRAFLQEALPDYMTPSFFVVMDSLPLMPNGKVDRRALPAPGPDRPDIEQDFVAPRTATERQLSDIWADILRIEAPGVHDNFFELGGDSILSIQIVARANQAGLQLKAKDMFQHQTIAELAAVEGAAAATEAEQGPVTGPVPITPIQRWLVEQELPVPDHWNQAVFLNARQRLDFDRVQEALGALLAHHDALRLRLVRNDSGWSQSVSGADEAPSLKAVDLSGLPQESRPAAVEAAASDIHRSLNLADGPLLAAALFENGPDLPNSLLLSIHHCAVDAVSWRVLLEDFRSAYQQTGRDGTIRLPAKTTSFKRWAELLEKHAQGDASGDEIDFWFSTAAGGAPNLPRDFAGGENLEATARTLTVSLDGEETHNLLKLVPRAYSTRIDETLLTALALTLSEWSGEKTLLLDLEGHGREDVIADADVSRTVGWFTSLFPVRLELTGAEGPREAIIAVKEQLRRIPHGGIGYGILKYLRRNDPRAEKLRGLPQPEICFNYLGHFARAPAGADLFEGPGTGPAGMLHGPRGRRPYLLEVFGMIAEGRLTINWIYSEDLYRAETIRKISGRFLEHLRGLVAHCTAADAGARTPSDFPLAGLDQAKLDRLAAMLGPSGGQGKTQP